MDLKSKRKIRPKFSVSSLTDIIFLLLLVSIMTFSVKASVNTFNLKSLDPPYKSTPVVEKLDDVTITKKGRLIVNGRTTSKSKLNEKLNVIRRRKGKKVSMTISPKKGAPTESIVLVMDAMQRLGINGILVIEDE